MNTIDKARIMHAAFFTPTARGWGLPLLWWGAPGIGKTAQHKAFAASIGAPLEVLAPGERGEGAFGVVPVPAESNGAMVLRYPVPEWTEKVKGFGLVLVDEYTTAAPAIQPALLSLVLEGLIGGAKLGPRVRLFAAANPVECSAGGYDIAPPAANRHIHLTWEVSASEITDYFNSGLLMQNTESMKNAANTIDPANGFLIEENRVLEVWPAAMASAASKVSAFLKSHPDLLHKMPQEGDPNRSKAWPSPRSWEMAIRCIASGIAHNLTLTEVDTLGAGCVGESAWQEYCDYIASLDLPDPASVLDGVSQWQPNTTRLDVTSAVIAGCVALVTPANAPKRADRGAALWALLDKVGAMGARDLTHLPATNMIKASGLATLPGANKVMADMRRTGFMQAVQA